MQTVCEKCGDSGFEAFESLSGHSASRLCSCVVGRSIKRAREPIIREPVLSGKDTEIFVEMLAAIPYFPGESGARLMIGEEIRSMCADAGEAMWLVQRAARLFPRWPGLAELRRLYCSSKRCPLDGVWAVGISEGYPNGYPGETRPLLIDAPNKTRGQIS